MASFSKFQPVKDEILTQLQQYTPGMWGTIGMQLLYAVVTFAFSMWLKRQNRLADEGKRPALEGEEGFRYAP